MRFLHNIAGASRTVVTAFVAGFRLLTKTVFLCAVAFVMLSLAKGGEPFRRISQQIDCFFYGRVFEYAVSPSRCTAMLAKCGEGAMLLSDSLADIGDRIIKIRRGIDRIIKAREEAGRRAAEHIKRVGSLEGGGG